MQLSQWPTQKDYLSKRMHESQCLRHTRLLIRARIFLLEEWGFNLFSCPQPLSSRMAKLNSHTGRRNHYLQYFTHEVWQCMVGIQFLLQSMCLLQCMCLQCMYFSACVNCYFSACVTHACVFSYNDELEDDLSLALLACVNA